MGAAKVFLKKPEIKLFFETVKMVVSCSRYFANAPASSEVASSSVVENFGFLDAAMQKEVSAVYYFIKLLIERITSARQPTEQ